MIYLIRLISRYIAAIAVLAMLLCLTQSQTRADAFAARVEKREVTSSHPL